MGEVIIFLIIFLIANAIKKDKKKPKQADKAPAAAAPQPAQAAAKTEPLTEVARQLKGVAKEFAEEFAGDEIQALNELLDKKTARKPQAAKPAASKKTAIEIAMEAFGSQSATRPAPVRMPLVEGELAPGESAVDAHGCIGGSMEHHSSEGETVREHAGHERRRQARLAEEAAQPVASRRKITAQELRRAVVMSEILDRPKALRR